MARCVAVHAGGAEIDRLEAHLSKWPAFEAPFEEVIAHSLDSSGWKHLDGLWKEKGSTNPRFEVLRGMLAERQGEFSAAAQHYEVAAKTSDEWAVYHRCRLLAFAGDLEAARLGLDQLAKRTPSAYLFANAALGVGEFVLLKQGAEAAEKHYAALWDARPELAMRLALLEPLLALRLELGRGSAWLESLKPQIPGDGGVMPEAEAQKGLLWLYGSNLIRVYWQVPKPLSPNGGQMSRAYGREAPPTRPGTLEVPTGFEGIATAPGCGQRYSDLLAVRSKLVLPRPAEALRELVATNSCGDSAVESLFSQDVRPFQPGGIANPALVREMMLRYHRVLVFPKSVPVSEVLDRALILKATLRENPWLLSSLFFRVGDSKAASETHGFLAKKIFDGVDHPSWRLMSLLLRVQAGVPANALHEEAWQLWHAVIPEQRLVTYNDTPAGTGMLSPDGVSHSLVDLRLAGAGLQLRGIVAPSTAVIWNLRGRAFLEAMQARFRFGLQADLFLSRPDRPVWQSATSRKFDASGGELYIPSRVAGAVSGITLRACLWTLREKLGLTGAEFGSPGTHGEDFPERVADVLVRGSVDETAQFILGAKDLEKLPVAWLHQLKWSIAMRTDEEVAQPPDSDARMAAERQIDMALSGSHPDWLATALLAVRPLSAKPVLNASERAELIANYDRYLELANLGPFSPKKSGARFAQWKENWSKIDSQLADGKKGPVLVEITRNQLELPVLPHPLWGLTWKPSVGRLTSTLSGSGEFVPNTPKFLTARLPELAKAPAVTYHFQPFQEEAGVLGRTASKLMTAFGAESMTPQLAREAELRSYAEKYPFVADLLAIWAALDRTQPYPQILPLGVAMSPQSAQEVLAALAKSGTLRARMILAVLHRHYGDPALAQRLAEGLKGIEGPVGQLAGVLAEDAKRALEPEVAPTARDELPDQDIIVLAKAGIEHGSAEDDWSRLLNGLAQTETSKKMLYAWLKAEVKPEPAFAKHACALAALAQSLTLPDAEVAAAEDLEIKLNPENSGVWFRRSERLIRRGENTLLEAMRRWDLANSPSGLSPDDAVFWLGRLHRAGRIEEGIQAFESALKRTPEGEAPEEVVLVLQAAIQFLTGSPRGESYTIGKVSMSRGKTGNPPQKIDQTIRSLMEVVFAHQGQLISWNFRCLQEQMTAFEKGGKPELATFLARLLVRGNRCVEAMNEVDANECWGTSDEVTPNPPVFEVFELALRGDDVEGFVRDLAADAQQLPPDEYLVSTALVILARRGPLASEVAKPLLDKLDPQGAMRVAWRLCEYAPAANFDLPVLVPSFERGLIALSEDDENYVGYGCRHYLLLAKVTPWLEKAGAREAISRLVPRYVEIADDDVAGEYWTHLASLSARIGDEASLAKVVAKWQELCRHTLEGQISVEWTQETIAALGTAARTLGKRGAPLAKLAFEVWNTFSQKYASVDLPAETAAQVGAALLSTGERESLQALISSLNRTVQLGGDPGLAIVRDSISRASALLASNESSLPTPVVWAASTVAEPGEATVSWCLTPGSLADPLPKTNRHRRNEERLSSPGLFGQDSTVILHTLGGRYDLELLAGESPEDLRQVARISNAGATGSVKVASLPPSGWLGGLLRSPRSGAIQLGVPVPFSRGPVLADTDNQPNSVSPVWSEDLNGRFGVPLCAAFPLNEGARLLVLDRSTMDVRGGREDATSLVILDENQKPLGAIPLAYLQRGDGGGLSNRLKIELATYPDGTRVTLLDLSEWAAARMGEQEPLPAPRFALLANRSANSARSTALQIRAFCAPSRQASVAPSPLPPLDFEVVAHAGFGFETCYASGTLSRAAILKPGELVVFDTSLVPWKVLARVHDDGIKATDHLFLASANELYLLQWAADRNQRAGCRLIRWDRGAVPAFKDCPWTDFPFDPVGEPGADCTSLEFAPHGEGVLFFASGGVSDSLRLVWLDSAGRVSSTQVRQAADSDAFPVLAWWGKDGRFVVHHDGTLYHFRRGPGPKDFSLERAEPGGLNLASVPPGAVPGRALGHRRWQLKRPTIIIEQDPVSGEVLRGFQLKDACRGVPISTQPGEVLLQGPAGEIRLARPPLNPGSALQGRPQARARQAQRDVLAD